MSNSFTRESRTGMDRLYCEKRCWLPITIPITLVNLSCCERCWGHGNSVAVQHGHSCIGRNDNREPSMPLVAALLLQRLPLWEGKTSPRVAKMELEYLARRCVLWAPRDHRMPTH